MSNTNAPSQRVKSTDAGDGVRLITLDNPPVNALSYALSGELVPLIEAADKAIRSGHRVGTVTAKRPREFIPRSARRTGTADRCSPVSTRAPA